MQTDRGQLDYYRRLACEQYSHAVDERLEIECSHRQEELAWKRRVRDLESRVYAAVDVEGQTYKKNIEVVVRIAGEDIRRSRNTDARTRVVTFMDSLGVGVEGNVVRMGDTIDVPRQDLTDLIEEGPRAACEEPGNLGVADFTTPSNDASAALSVGSTPADESVR